MSMAQTAVLGDSDGSVAVDGGLLLPASDNGEIPDEDLAPDGGVGGGLGGSYVDGGKRAKVNMQDDEEEELEDGGVLGLLAQIYGGRGLQA
jgi:autophagy-related protein 9